MRADARPSRALTSHPCSRPTPRPHPCPCLRPRQRPQLVPCASAGSGTAEGPTLPASCCVHPTEYVRMCTLAWLKKVSSFGTRKVSGCVSTSSASLSGESSPVCGSSELGPGRLQAAGCRLQAAQAQHQPSSLGSWVVAPRRQGSVRASALAGAPRARAPGAAQSRVRSPGQGPRSQRSALSRLPFRHTARSDLVERSEGALEEMLVGAVEHLVERGQQCGPQLEPLLHRDRRDA